MYVIFYREKNRHNGRDSDNRDMNTDSTSSSPSLPFPLNSPFLTVAAIFQKQSTTTLLSKVWSPVLLCMSTSSYIHIFDIDADADKGTDASAFSSAAGRCDISILICFTVESV